MRGAAALGATPAKDGVRPVRLLIAPGRETRRGKGHRLSSDAFRVTYAGIGGSRPISLETSGERSSDANCYVEAGVWRTTPAASSCDRVREGGPSRTCDTP